MLLKPLLSCSHQVRSSPLRLWLHCVGQRFAVCECCPQRWCRWSSGLGWLMSRPSAQLWIIHRNMFAVRYREERPSTECYFLAWQCSASFSWVVHTVFWKLKSSRFSSSFPMHETCLLSIRGTFCTTGYISFMGTRIPATVKERQRGDGWWKEEHHCCRLPGTLSSSTCSPDMRNDSRTR